MSVDNSKAVPNNTEQLFAGGGQMGSLMRVFDWTKTALGPPEQWSPTLRMMIKILLANRFPMLLWWGPDFLQIYNDAYAPILGDKHPRAALGQPFRECWAEVFPLLGPLAQTPFEGGPATWVDDILCEVNRYGFLEETHFTIAYSPVPADEAPSGIGGVLATVHEITEQVIGDRRSRLLRDIGLSAIDGNSAEEACIRAAESLKGYAKDIPFGLIYLIEAHSKIARLAGVVGIEAGLAVSPASISLEDGEAAVWDFAEILKTECEKIVDLTAVEGVPIGDWSHPPRQAIVIPIPSNTAHKFAGFFVAGLSPRLAFDEAYRNFMGLAVSQIATIVAKARAYEEERKRADALAEIDRAKSIFFSNVSHEFRTPLTLIMGPLQEMIADVALPAHVRDSLDVARRNSLRLQKLVNNLLEFSRIEAGKARAIFEAVDLGLFTEELASGFQSAFEKAGISLTLSISNFSSPVYLDREMREKIVLNLLSNAMKFTLVGGVSVELREQAGFAHLIVSDTGIGISNKHLTRIFGRFERIEEARGRSSEGSGIGLALVQELVKLHQGSISVESEEGVGTRFTVRLPIDANRVFSEDRKVIVDKLRTNLTDAFVLEALDWISAADSRSMKNEEAVNLEATAAVGSHAPPKRVLIADDNADMRRYIRRLLEDRFDVEAVTNGVEAQASIARKRPDLLISDVMMPVLDGLSLLRAIRENAETASLPIILLSARAGEEAAIEGLQSGADDYLVKPFSASELVARVRSALEIAGIRNRAEQSLRAEQGRLLDLFRQAPVFLTVLRGPEHIFEMTNLLYDELIGNRDVVGKSVREAIPEALGQGFVGLLDEVYRSGEVFSANGLAIDLARTSGKPLERRYLDFVYQPMKEPDGAVTGIIAVGVDVTNRTKTENALQEQRERFSFATNAAGVGYWFCDLPFAELIWDDRVKEHFWLAADAHVTIETFYRCIHPDDREPTRHAIETSIAARTTYDTVYRTMAEDGRSKWIRAIGRTAYGGDGSPVRFDGITIDITHQKHSEDALLRNEKLAVVGRMAASISHEINNPLEAVTNLLYLIRTQAESSETLSGYALQAEEELARVSQIVTHTLQFNRQSSEPQEQSLSNLMESAVAIYSARLMQAGVRLVRDYREQQPILAMQSEIRQVLSNLIGNAHDALNRGGTLTLRTRDSVNWETGHKGVRVTIADTGHGMDKSTLRRLFDPFFTTKGHNGTGLGLWVSAEILKRHKSSIRVKSWQRNGSSGTAFSILFPSSSSE